MSKRHPIAVASLAILTVTFTISGVTPFVAQSSQGATLAERMSGFKNLFNNKDSENKNQGQQRSVSNTRKPGYRSGTRSQTNRNYRSQANSQSQSKKSSLSKYLPKSLFGSKQQEGQTAQKTQQANRQRQQNRQQQRQLANSQKKSSNPRSSQSNPTRQPSIEKGAVIVESKPAASPQKSKKVTSVRKSPRIASRDDLQEALADLQDSTDIMPGSVVIDSETVEVGEDGAGTPQEVAAIAMDDYGVAFPKQEAEPEDETAQDSTDMESDALVASEAAEDTVESEETFEEPIARTSPTDEPLEVLGQVPVDIPPSLNEEVDETESPQNEVESELPEQEELVAEQETSEEAEPKQFTVTSVPFGQANLDIHDALLDEELYADESDSSVSESLQTKQTEQPEDEAVDVEESLADAAESEISEELPKLSVPVEPAPDSQERVFAVEEIDTEALRKSFADETEDTEAPAVVETDPEGDVIVSDSEDSSSWSAATKGSNAESTGEPLGPEFFDEVIEQPSQDRTESIAQETNERPLAATIKRGEKQEVTRLVRPRGDVLTTVEQPVIRSHVEGPSSILVGKEASYRVVLENTSQTTAHNLSAAVKVPEWADLVDVICSDGLVEQVRDENNSDSLQWSLSKLEAHTSQTMQLKLIPRSGRAFQLGVQWKQQATKSETTVEVKEPKLALKLNGPEKVLFGEPRRYQLVLENPGNAPAENVAISLIPPGSDSESASTHVLGTLKPQEVKELELELTAREAGEMVLHAYATAKNDLRTDAIKRVKCQKPELKIDWRGPDEKFAGTETAYYFRVSNPGNASTKDVEVKVQLPKGVRFISASDSFSFDSRSGLVLWKLDELGSKEEQFMQIRCELDLPGVKQFEVKASAAAGLVSESKTIRTDVVALADLKLEVRDPRGAQPTGEPVTYEIRVENRGSTDAEGISIVGLFSQGIDPVSVEGAESSVKDGRVNFRSIKSLPPGGEVILHIRAVASEVGMHIFRAEVACQDLDIKLAAEETTRFFEDNFGWNDGEQPYTAVRSDDTVRR